MATRLLEDEARSFANDAYSFMMEEGGKFNKRPSAVLAFSRHLDITLDSAETAFKAMEGEYSGQLKQANLRYLNLS